MSRLSVITAGVVVSLGVVLAAQPTMRATHAFTVMSSGVPFVLAAGEQVGVAVTLRNDGSETWNSAHGFRVSYHWLSLRGAIVERDGARTELPQLVAPNATVDFEVRLIAPERTGLHRLQWDMVQENVTWFSVRDPHPPAARLVLIVPQLNAGFNVLAPLGTIGLALLAFRYAKRRSWAVHPALLALLGLSDVIWCTLSLWTKQWSVLAQADMRPAWTHPWIALTMAALFPIALAWLSRRTRPWILWCVAAFGTLVVLADLIYFRYFSDIISAPAILAAGQTGHLGADILNLLEFSDIWLAVDLVAAIPLCLAVSRFPGTNPSAVWARRIVAAGAVLTLVPGVALAAKISVTDARAFRQVFRTLFLVQDLGLFGYHAYDIGRHITSSALRADLTPAELEEVRRWFADRASQRSGQGRWFGAARGRNLIVIQVESMQQFVLQYRIQGQDVMPSLNRRLNDAVWFSRVTDQTSEGRTSDGEFASLVSLLPIEQGAVAFRYPANHYVALPEVLASHGYHTLSAVAFDPDFWNRRLTHPAYGFSRSLFIDDFLPGEKVGWGLNDRDFLVQLSTVIRTLPRPFALWGITLSLHHPFAKFPNHLKSLDVGPWADRPFGNYLHSMRFFDRAFDEFIAALDTLHLLDDTVIVVMGDHDAGLRWEPRLARAIGFPHNQLEWTLKDRVPFVVWVPGANAPRGEITTVAGQTDIAPTLLSLLGIDAAPLPFVGRNVLGDAARGPVLRPHGNWIDETHLFVRGGERPDQQMCYDTTTRQRVTADACQATAPLASQAYRMSQRVVVNDLQERLAADGVR